MPFLSRIHSLSQWRIGSVAWMGWRWNQYESRSTNGRCIRWYCSIARTRYRSGDTPGYGERPTFSYYIAGNIDTRGFLCNFMTSSLDSQILNKLFSFCFVGGLNRFSMKLAPIRCIVAWTDRKTMLCQNVMMFLNYLDQNQRQRQFKFVMNCISYSPMHICR